MLPGSEISEKERKRFYQLRSALTHGGRLMIQDEAAWGFTPKRQSEWYDAARMRLIVQIVLHNWLAQA